MSKRRVGPGGGLIEHGIGGLRGFDARGPYVAAPPSFRFSLQPASASYIYVLASPVSVILSVATANGVGDVDLQWEVEVDDEWEDVASETSATFNVVSMDYPLGARFRCRATDDEQTIYSNEAEVFVATDALNLTTQPANTTKAPDETATFTVVAADGFPGYTYQWQVDTGGGFANITGATSASYETGILVEMDDGNEYRCIVRDSRVPQDEVVSDAAVLTVSAVPDFPDASDIVLLYDSTAASPVSLFAAAALTTYNFTGSGDTTLAHAQGVCLFAGESIEISGCTGDGAPLNGTHTVVTSGSNTLTIATPLGLSPTVGAVSIPGTPLFNPVLRWISQINDFSGNDFHVTYASRAVANRWNASTVQWVFPPTIAHDGVISSATSLRDLMASKPGVIGFVLARTPSIGQSGVIGANGGGQAINHSADTTMRIEIGTNFQYDNAGLNTADPRTWIINYTGSARNIYLNGVGSAVQSDALSALPSVSAAFDRLGRRTTSRMRGEMPGLLIYADNALTGTGELQALYDAMAARWT
jgi:hypothetical protein